MCVRRVGRRPLGSNDRREVLDQPEFRTATHDTAFVGTFADRLAPDLANAAAG